MRGEWTVALAPLVALVVNAMTEIVCAHVSHLQLSKSIVGGFLCGLAVTVALILLGLAKLTPNYVESADVLLVGSLTYLALAYGFWAFLNLAITSLRIRVLREMLRAGGSTNMAELLRRYAPVERLGRRLERLKNGKQICLERDRWRLNSYHVLTIARSMEMLRRIVLPAAGENTPKGR